MSNTIIATVIVFCVDENTIVKNADHIKQTESTSAGKKTVKKMFLLLNMSHDNTHARAN